jgi:endo-1,4-beta-xylanase
MTILRRDLINTAALTALSRVLAGAESSTETLRSAGARKNVLVGTAVSFRELQRPEFTALLVEQAAIVVPENEMKWSVIHPKPDRFDFSRGDALVEFASSHNQRVRGHNLCWHEQLPAWFKDEATSNNVLDLLRTHISEVVTHYNGRMHSWDVVNEAVNVKDGRSDGLRNTPWLALAGPEYLDVAFRAARAYDRKALLAYNDYDLEQDSPDHQAKREAVLALLAGLRERNVPIDALGLQAHLKARAEPPQWDGLRQFMNDVERLGLQIFITELDVDDTDLPGDVAERDRLVAGLYGDFLSQVLRHKSVTALLTWGLTDADSWLKSFRPRKDKLPPRPLPFDADLRPKPAFSAMRDRINAAPVRAANHLS